MAVILDLFPSFYLDGKAHSLTRSEFESIIPKKLSPTVTLLLPDIIDDEIQAESEEQAALKHGFHSGIQVKHHFPLFKNKALDIGAVLKQPLSKCHDLFLSDPHKINLKTPTCRGLSTASRLNLSIRPKFNINK